MSRHIVTVALVCLLGLTCAEHVGRLSGGSFDIQDDRFVKDGEPFQIISGSFHYFRIPPFYWKDRLERGIALGLNSIEVYVAWNFHEPVKGEHRFDGWQDLEKFLSIAHDLGLLVVLRPGPYICAEWDFGGLPAWLMDPSVEGCGPDMPVRSADERYLRHVQDWWDELLPRMEPLLYHNGGPIVMVQIENEYGIFPPWEPDYMKFLTQLARKHLGDDVILFTTDPPSSLRTEALAQGVVAIVDFGPGNDVNWCFDQQKKFNPQGKSPPMCSEYYPGWLTHWGELMANTSAVLTAKYLQDILQYGNNSGSVNFYMAHGGTSFGYWAGANSFGASYQPDITSYDYDAPISEAGDYGQPGIGGPNKFEMLRDVIQTHLNTTLPDPPARPDVASYGNIEMRDHVAVVDVMDDVADDVFNHVKHVKHMEAYGAYYGFINYRTTLEGERWANGGELMLNVADFAVVMLDGATLATWWTNAPQPIAVPAITDSAVLDIFVEAMGRDNFKKSSVPKGMLAPPTIDGEELHGWTVYALSFSEIESVSAVLRHQQAHVNEIDDDDHDNDRDDDHDDDLDDHHDNDHDDDHDDDNDDGDSEHDDVGVDVMLDVDDATEQVLHFGKQFMPQKRRRGLHMQRSTSSYGSTRMRGAAAIDRIVAETAVERAHVQHRSRGPTFWRGTFTLESGDARLHADGSAADTWLATPQWGKGVAWVNGFNLGRYWPSQGPQMKLYIPGPLLREGENEIVLLELVQAAPNRTVELSETPDFFGPHGPSGLVNRVAARVHGFVDQASLFLTQHHLRWFANAVGL